MQAILKLTRWQEYVPFTIPLSLLGGLMAYRFTENLTLDIRLFYVLAANCLAVGYAFMINDIEDAEDDKKGARAKRNAIATGEISVRAGWAASLVVALMAAGLYALGGRNTFFIGLLTLILAHTYSWKPVRLKAWPVVDILSHVLMLAALLMLAPYMIYDSSPSLEVWLVTISVTLVSTYGQLYNQLRDFDADQAAGLKNTANLLGKRLTQAVSFVAIGAAGACLGAAIVMGAFPWLLLPVLLIALPLARLVGKGRDMRGDTASDIISQTQVQFLLEVNIVLVVWLAYVLLRQP